MFVLDKEIFFFCDKYRMKFLGYNLDVDYVKFDSC